MEFNEDEEERIIQEELGEEYRLKLMFFIRHGDYWVYKRLNLYDISNDTARPYWRAELSVMTASEIEEMIWNGPPEKRERKCPEMGKVIWSEEGGWVGDKSLPAILRN